MKKSIPQTYGSGGKRKNSHTEGVADEYAS
jgi:hypothetical protein